MLNYKRFKELKSKLKILIIQTFYSKYQIRTLTRQKDYRTLRLTLHNYQLQKQEINYLTEILRMHKILYKQYLRDQALFRDL